MSDSPAKTGLTRRHFLEVNATVLASVAIATAVPGAAQALVRAPRAEGALDLAADRPVSVSSTAHAPTPAQFAVDGLAEVGVRGSGWRAADGAEQWIAVDLEGSCTITGVRLVFEAKEGDKAFVGASGDNPRAGTDGSEILSSYASSFRIETSTDGKAWTPVYSTTSSTGGAVDVTLDAAVTARHVRLTSLQLSTTNPLGLNGFQVFGTSGAERPDATGWTRWGSDDTPAPALEVADDGTVPVESGWRLTLDDWAGPDDGAALATVGVDTSAWLPATVPGTVLASLVEQGHLPDPVFGLDNLNVPEALSRHAWWYRRELEVPAALDRSSGRHVWLELDGINHQADVWLNGTSLGTLVHPFSRAAYDVTQALAAAGPQALAAKISPMPKPGSPGDKGEDGASYTDAGSGTVNQASPTWLSVTGWDWMPAVRDRASGIWNHVRLRSTGAARIGDTRIDTALPDLPATSTAELTVTVPVHNAESGSRQVEVQIAVGGATAKRTVTVPGGGTADATFAPADFAALRLQDPELWWPHGYGEAALHDLDVTLRVGGTTSDERTVRFGMRQIDYDYDPPFAVENGKDRAEQTVELDRQTARYLRIVGDKRSSSWGISMWSLAVRDSADAATDLARGATATASSVDQPGHEAPLAVDGDPKTRWSSAYKDGEWIQLDLGAATTFDRVEIAWESALASQFRVQVSSDGKSWTDVTSVDNGATPLQISVNGVRVLCRGGNWGWDELLKRGADGRIDAMVRMHRDMNFTMIRVWLGTSDREEFYDACDRYGILVWNDFPLAWTLDPPDHAVFVEQSRDTVLRYRSHPCLAVWCGANEGTPPKEVDDGLRKAVTDLTPLLYHPNSREGIVSGGGAYWYTSPEGYYTGAGSWNSFGFHTEVGLPTVSVAASMRNLVGTGQEWPPGDAWWLHDWSTKGAANPNGYKDAIERRLGAGTSLDDFCAKAQFVNYESMRALFEAWNSKMWNPSSGLLLWMSSPAWHSTVWQTYDYDLDVNGSYHGARKACELLHVQADATDWTVRAVNQTSTALEGASVTTELFGFDGTRLADPRTDDGVDVAPSSFTALAKVAFGASLPAAHLLRLRLHDADGTLLSENVYWRYRKDTDMQSLNDVGRTTVSAEATWDRADGTGAVTVRNTGARIASMVRVSLRDRASGERALPAFASDNYVWLLPGEERTLTLEHAAWTGRGGAMDVVVEGYNLATTTTPVVTVDVDPRKVGALAYLAVRVLNGGDAPVDVTVTTPFGKKSFSSVAPGKSAYQSFNTRGGSFEAGSVTVTTKVASGAAASITEQVAYPASDA
ncbi:discoidin domain-containing protein [Cellulomonas sp. PhB143]|uniref:discoidin domain-containing protein n=1 Tax=Cellulomonas sp. PhB143 TaxID=2485186 RepID=UPI000F468C8E|nr:discoidin domain-containing protein [Cellulomonas sp. PhB143]ROS75429.1 F5/8 type C domain-containing protein [Cellulomonas sp. PhB143]